MESLFGYRAASEQPKIERKKEPVAFEVPKYIQIIDPRKAQNLSILLRALNVTTDEVCEAILEGNYIVYMYSIKNKPYLFRDLNYCRTYSFRIERVFCIIYCFVTLKLCTTLAHFRIGIRFPNFCFTKVETISYNQVTNFPLSLFRLC